MREEARAGAFLVLDTLQESGIAVPQQVRPRVVDCLDHGLDFEETEGLLVVRDTHEGPSVVRYNLKAIIVGVVGVVGGLQASVVGAAVALAGLWTLCDARTPLSPTIACLVATLHDNGGLLSRDQLQERLHGHCPGLVRLATHQYDAHLVALEQQGVLRFDGDSVLLADACYPVVRVH